MAISRATEQTEARAHAIADEVAVRRGDGHGVGWSETNGLCCVRGELSG